MKKKLFLLTFFLFVFQNFEAQVQKVETYLVGTKVTYYPDQCGNTIPEAEGKISFCDSENNLGVVESSYGLNYRAIKKMVPNYYNDDEVFITEAGISIKKTDGTWENIPSFAAPRATLNTNPPTMSEAVVNSDGLLFFVHGNNHGLQYFDLTTKTFGSISYNTGTGGSETSYTHSFTYDVANNITYIIVQSESNLRIYKHENSVLSFIAVIPAPIYIGGYSSSFLFANDALYLGTNTGLYKLNKTTIVIEGSYLTDATQYIVNVQDIADDGNGNLWLANRSYYDAAIYRLNIATENITTYQLANAANNNYTFENLDIDTNGTVWAIAANLSGIVELVPDETNPIWTIRTMEDMNALGFPMTYSPLEVYKFNNKIYFMTTSNPSSSPDANYEAIVYDNGVWSGITDDEVNNLSEKMLTRYQFAYPDADGIWWYNGYDGGIMTHVSTTDEWKKQYNLGSGISSFIIDVDGNPVINDSRLKKVYMPYVATLEDHGGGNITRFIQYKDQIWMFSNDTKKIYVYKYNQLIQTFNVDDPVYTNWFYFTPDINGNAFFARNDNMDLEFKKFDTSSQTTTIYSSSTYLGTVRKLIPLPNGNVAVICSSGVFLFDGTTLTAIGSAIYSDLYNIVDGVADTNGKIHILTNDLAKIVSIENPESASPTFSTIVVEGTSGLVPYNGFYRPYKLAIDANGAFWTHASTKWFKITTENTASQFLNEGETFGITGSVYVDVNENNLFDANEGYPNQKLALKTSSGTIYELFTDFEGNFYFPNFEGLGAYEITLPVLSPYVEAQERQRLVNVTSLDANTSVNNIQLQPKNIQSLLVKSSSKQGAWGFDRSDFENTFTTAIGNISYSKVFNNVTLDYVFFNKEEDSNNTLPAIEEVKITRLQPTQPFHIIEKLTIEPRSHNWDANVAPSTYTLSEMSIVPTITTVADTTRVTFTLPIINPLDTYILEIKTELFSPVNNGSFVVFGVSKASSDDFGDSLPGQDFFLLIPRDPELGQGLPDFSGPYKSPEEIYSDPPYIPRKEIYSDGPYEVPIRSSYDPNDKLVNPGVPDMLNETPINEKWLTYIIRFQNEGNFSAKDVFVVDELDEKFDQYSLTLLESSHPLSIETIKSESKNIVKFNFKDIYLDYKSNDELASQGYLKYMIKAKDNVVIDDIMENRASIYFDQNPPIITNLTQNKYVEVTLDVSEFASVDQSIKLWPNPVDHIINLKTTEGFSFRTSIYNLLGQEIKSDANFKTDHQLNVSHLKTGIYIISITYQNGNSKSIKFIKN